MSPRWRRGFTLVELVVSAAIMAVLATGMASAVLIATRALPSQASATADAARAVSIADQLADDLALATSITKIGANGIEFTVPDRGHGAPGGETIRYEWSGVAGGPLTRQYNGGTIVKPCDSVQDFSLDYTLKAMPLLRSPRVLQMCLVDTSLTAEDSEKKALMESWGFSVTALAANKPAATIAAAAVDADVIYVSEEISSADLAGKIDNISVGVVTEEGQTYDDFSIAETAYYYNTNSIVIVDNAHEITNGLSLGNLTLCSSSQQLIYAAGNLAAGAQILARLPYASTPALMTVEVGGALLNGRKARARRVTLPWGNSPFQTASLTSDGHAIMRRAIVWAAAPVAYSDVSISLQISKDDDTGAARRVQLMNAPEVIRP